MFVPRHEPEQQPLANAENGEHHFRRSDGFEQPLQHQRTVRQHVAASPRHRFDPQQRRDLFRAADELAELDRLSCRNCIAVHDAQRIPGLLHVKAGKRTPRAAHRIERTRPSACEPGNARHRLVDDRQGAVDLVSGFVDETQPAEGQRVGMFELVAGDIDHLEAAAPEIARQPIGRQKSHADAVSGELRLRLAREDLDTDAGNALGLLDEKRSVLRVAHGRRRQHAQVLDLEHPRHRAKTRQRFECPLNAFGTEEARGRNRVAKPGKHLLVEDRRGRAHSPVVDDEPHRVRPDVDDADRLKLRSF